MPEELGEVEEAHLTSEGSLIVSLLDGQVDSFDLSHEENRGLLVSAMEDLVPKLHSVLDGSYKLPELIIEEEVVEPEALEEPEEVAEEVAPPVPEAEEEPAEVLEPTPEELPEEAVVEPEAEELLEEEEPEIIEPPVEEDTVAVPEVEEPTVEEFSLPEFDPEAQLSEAPEPTRERPKLIERTAKPPIARDAQVRRLRKSVRRQRSSAQREMDKVRRQREAQIRRLRVTNGMIIPYGKQGKGLLSKLKELFTRRRRRR
jgi:pyruvate/2-oxoglutarate dehydrogenase complex dihydrolipoamide acyltransferase (E2) component